MNPQLFLKQHQTKLHFIALGIAAYLQLINPLLKLVLPILTAAVPPDIANGITFALLAYVLVDISRNTYNFNRNKSYEEQVDLYKELEKHIDERGAKAAILVQYSSTEAMPLIRKLIGKGASVTLYVQNPVTAALLGSHMQKERIENAIKNMRGVLTVSPPYSLTVYYYDAPASVRAAFIDEQVLAIGWYTYEHAVNRDPDYPQDFTEVSGHDIPGMLLYHGTPEFSVLSKTLMKLVGNYKQHREATKKSAVLKLPQEEAA